MYLWNSKEKQNSCNMLGKKLFRFVKCYILVNHGKVFGGYWKEVHRVENVYVNLALHSIREMAALTRLRIFQHQNLNWGFKNVHKMHRREIKTVRTMAKYTSTLEAKYFVFKTTFRLSIQNFTTQHWTIWTLWRSTTYGR